MESICPWKWDTQTPLRFWQTNGSPNLDQKTRLFNNQQKKKKKKKKKERERTCKIADFTVSVEHRVELKENEKEDKYINLPRQLKKTLEYESDDYTYCKWRSWYNHGRIGKGTGGYRNKRTNGDHPKYFIIDIGQNTEKRPGDLRRLAVTQNSVKDHLLTLM